MGWNGKGYVVTWKIGCSTFEQHEAKAYCNSLGMEPVSLDTPEKQNEFNRLIAQDAQRFFWTGGIVDHANRLVGWSNPASNSPTTELQGSSLRIQRPASPSSTISMLTASS